MSEDHKARIREFIDRVLTTGKIAATGDYFHEDMVEEVPFPGQGPGLDGLKETLTRIRRAFPDAQWRVEEQLAEDHRVLTRFIWSGTHQGEFLGIPATNRVVRVWGMVIDRFKGQHALGYLEPAATTGRGACSPGVRCRPKRGALTTHCSAP